ncbi:hypothetical protein SDC9_151174 [bioreactor metagenome]|uniref:Uncharacterized protein n=1 Tax=bioreactor metagenome TaxID=1076179 RepID=A0A645ERY6_9ZZZZ
MYRKFFQILQKLNRIKSSPGFLEIHAAIFAKDKTKTLEPELHLIFQTNFSLSSAYKQIQFTIILKVRNNFSRAAHMTVAGSLDGIQNLHHTKL